MHGTSKNKCSRLCLHVFEKKQHVPATCHMRQHKDPNEHNERQNETRKVA
jgi:hypothetical protein